MLVLDFFKARGEFVASSEGLVAHLSGVNANGHRAGFRITACSSDVLGAADAAFEAYKNYVPWFFEQIAEVERYSPPKPSEQDFKVLEKWVEDPSSLSSKEQSRLDERSLHAQTLLKAQMETRDRRRETGWDAARESDEQKLVSTFKAFVIFVRAYQDALYSAALVLNGDAWSPHASMKTAFPKGKLKKLNPVGAIIATTESYEEWFTWMRDIRNEYKLGTSNGCSGSFPDFGIGLSKTTSDRTVSTNFAQTFTFSRLSEALAVSSELNSAVIKKTEKKSAT